MIRGAVLGGNVGKSRSPVIHMAAFRALRLKGVYGAFSVDQTRFAPLVRDLAAQGYAYLNVTIPHKRQAAALADSRSPLVAATAAANTLIFRRARGRLSIRAENTDGYGLLAALTDLGIRSVRRQTVVMVGAGGAAAGALAALIRGGAAVRLLARRPSAATALRGRFPAGARARITTRRWTAAALAKALDGAGILVSAVSAAAWDSDGTRAGLRGLDRATAVLEMAYGGVTPLAKAVRPLVMRYQDGLPMLVHQAARAVELSLGRKPPPEPLLRAARK